MLEAFEKIGGDKVRIFNNEMELDKALEMVGLDKEDLPDFDLYKENRSLYLDSVRRMKSEQGISQSIQEQDRTEMLENFWNEVRKETKTEIELRKKDRHSRPIDIFIDANLEEEFF